MWRSVTIKGIQKFLRIRRNFGGKCLKKILSYTFCNMVFLTECGQIETYVDMSVTTRLVLFLSHTVKQGDAS